MTTKAQDSIAVAEKTEAFLKADGMIDQIAQGISGDKLILAQRAKAESNWRVKEIGLKTFGRNQK